MPSQTQLQELDDELQAGNTVEIGFGALFLQGDAPGELKPNDTPLLQGLQLWMDHAGAQGFKVGNGTVKFNLFVETANSVDGSCEEFISKAEKLVYEDKVRLARIICRGSAANLKVILTDMHAPCISSPRC